MATGLAFIAIALLVVGVAFVLYRAGAALSRRRRHWKVITQRVDGEGIAFGVQKGGNKRTFRTTRTIPDDELTNPRIDALLDEAAGFAARLNKIGVE